ncbi:MAG: hypothetical protein LBL61_00065 [Elusimicrobiota bacterium]|jgi:hypothetical protein|nr:hypothetical protein [Elusimicrobiota bacterium]
MKKLLVLLAACAALCACVGMSTTDGDSTKEWIKIDSSKSSLGGKVEDVCYRLDLRFSPPQAAYGFNRDLACVSKCCWYSERKSVSINPNEYFARDMASSGRAVKYTPEKITFEMSYSSFLNTIHGRAEPKSALKSGGLIVLEGVEVKQDSHYLPIGQEPYKIAVYDDAENAHGGTYLFKNQKPDTDETISFNDERERAEELQKKLVYERNQAVLLLKRFYNKDIDTYIHSIDKAQRAKGQVLLANDRQWITDKIGSPVYKVVCRVNAQLGKTRASMKPYVIDCGAYRVDLDEKTVTPADAVARAVVAGEYKD